MSYAVVVRMEDDQTATYRAVGLFQLISQISRTTPNKKLLETFLFPSCQYVEKLHPTYAKTTKQQLLIDP